MSGRIRTVKPELLEDAATANLSDTAFRLFVGMILLADDYGNLRAEPRFVRGQVYWARDPSVDLEASFAELEAKLVRFYSVGGQRYAHIAGWEKHQKVSHPGKPRVPGPSEHRGDPPPTLTRSSGESRETRVPDPDHDQRPTTPTNDRTRDDSRESPAVGGESSGSKPNASEEYASHWAAGISKATKVPRSVPDVKARGPINNATLVHFKALRGTALRQALEDSAYEFVLARPSQQRFGGFTPVTWLKWLDDGKPRDEVTGTRNRVQPSPQNYAEDLITAGERRAREGA